MEKYLSLYSLEYFEIYEFGYSMNAVVLIFGSKVLYLWMKNFIRVFRKLFLRGCAKYVQ